MFYKEIYNKKKISIKLKMRRPYIIETVQLREAVKKTGYFMTSSQFHFPPTHPT